MHVDAELSEVCGGTAMHTRSGVAPAPGMHTGEPKKSDSSGSTINQVSFNAELGKLVTELPARRTSKIWAGIAASFTNIIEMSEPL